MKKKNLFRNIVTIALGLCIALARIVYPSHTEITKTTVIIEFLFELTICLLILFVNRKQIKALFSKKIANKSEFVGSVFTIIAIMLVGGIILDLAFGFIYQLITNTPLSEVYDPASEIGNAFTTTFFLPVLLVQCIIAPIEEELVFRYTFREIFNKKNIVSILLFIILSSWAFGFIHSAVPLSPGMASYIFTGIILSIAYLKFKDIRLLIFAHMGYNSFLWLMSLAHMILNFLIKLITH